MPLSFAKDIRPIFRQIDVDHMSGFGVQLDDYEYMSDSSNDYANAQAVQDTLTKQTMPPNGPYWTSDQLALFAKWRSEGYKP